ncbi:MAG: ATP-binding protein [Celeribacter sp.]|jgi:signal transduction histidine kinase
MTDLSQLTDMLKSRNRSLRSILGMIGAAVALGLVVVTLITVDLVRTQTAIASRQTALMTDLVQFERTIGYGGFIHEFKNALLRPEDPKYLENARRSMAEALKALDGIEAQVNDGQMLRDGGATIALDLTQIRAALLAYRERIDWSERGLRNGLTARQIDDRVQVDDTEALLDLQDAVLRLRAALSRRQDRIRRGLWLLLGGTVVASLLGLSAVMVAYAHDRRRALTYAQAMAKRNTDLEEFTRIAAHDLRAPLRQVAQLADFIREDAGETDAPLSTTATAHLAMIEARVSRLSRMVGDTLSYLNPADPARHPEWIDLHALIRDITDFITPPGTEVRIEGDLTHLMVIRTELEIVLRNLAGNAVKHGPERGLRIVVRCQCRGDNWCIEVEDNGPGIDAAHRERVFGMFAALSAPAETEVSGVGLAVVRRLVRSWQGDVTIRDATPRGAIFEIRMPVAAS